MTEMDENPFNKSEQLNSLGVAQARENNFKEAISFFDKALWFCPDNENPLFNLGSVEIRLGRYEQAIKHLGLFIRHNKKNPFAYYKLASIFYIQGKAHQAEINYLKALKINPIYLEALVDLGSLYAITKHYCHAIKQFKKALIIAPNSSHILSLLFQVFQVTADFKGVKKVAPMLDRLTSQAIATENMTETPFTSISRKADPEENFKVADIWSRNIQRSVSTLQTAFSFPNRKQKKQKLNIGYLSFDFRNHPTSHLILGLFGLHDRKKFNIYTYSSGPDDKSSWRKEIKRTSDFFRDVSQLSNPEVAQQIYNDQIDILIDLMGYIQNSRMEILALRPAPIQISWLGFPGTTGADFIDYIIADKIVLPPTDRHYFSEKPLYLPCYQMNSFLPNITRSKIKKSDYGLPEDMFIFVSFNQTYKIESKMFELWIQILKSVPKSVLWLLDTNDFAKKNLKNEAKKRGIGETRIIFAPKLPKEQHLKRLSLADLSLDTMIYNGHTTTSDCLFAEVPVITLKGGHFASRVSASLLSAIGLPELITYSSQNYKNLAIDLATNPQKLKNIKNKLAKNKLISDLFKPKKFVLNLEKLYEKTWDGYIKTSL